MRSHHIVQDCLKEVHTVEQLVKGTHCCGCGFGCGCHCAVSSSGEDKPSLESIAEDVTKVSNNIDSLDVFERD